MGQRLDLEHWEETLCEVIVSECRKIGEMVLTAQPQQQSDRRE